MDKSCIIAIFLWSRRFSPYNRNRRTNRGAPRKFQKSFENGSALPTVFLLLVRGCFGRCENHRPFTTKVHRHIKPAFGCKRHYAAEAGLLLPRQVCHQHHTTGCGLPQERKANIATIQPAAANTAILYRRIGSTTYKVRVHFSDTAQETMNDKILHLIQHEAVTNAADCGTMNIPQMTQPLEGSSL